MKIPYEHISIVVILLALFTTALSGFTLAGSTIKALSTNYALVNFGTEDAHVLVCYIKDNGITWTDDPDNTEFDVPANYGMVQVRLYSDDYLDPR